MKLSLAMIAKNEEENINACLASVKAHVDEIIVVDTGSTDRTPEVAQRHGARVHCFDPHTNPEAFFIDDEATCKVFEAPGEYSGKVMLGDFAAARRFSFEKTTGDFILWLDADDVLEGAEHLRPLVAQMVAQNLDMGFLAYDYARDHLGRTFYRQWRERVLRRGCASWVNPVHEVLLPTRPVTSLRFEGLTVAHHRKADRVITPHRNYKILLRQFHQEKKNGTAHDPRTLFYLGQEARWVEPVRASEFYEQYLQQSGWPEERAAAHVALGSILEFGQMPGVSPTDAYARANREYATAAAEMPTNPDGLFGLARIAYLRGRWQDCIDYTNRGMAVGNTDSMLGANPMDRLYRPHVYYNHALHKLGRTEEAIASCKAALAICPDDPGVPGGAQGMLQHNLKCYETELAGRPPSQPEGAMINFDKNEDVDAPAQQNIPNDALVIWAMQLWKQARGDERRERAILEGLTFQVSADPAVARMHASTARRFPKRNDTLVERAQLEHRTAKALDTFASQSWADQVAVRPHIGSTLDNFLEDEDIDLRKKDGPLSVVIYTGPAPEPWDPTTPNTKGLGGSETAAIEMAKNLAALGHDVTVFGDTPNQETQNHDSVTYIHHRHFGVSPGNGIDCDVFISSRAPWAINQFGTINAKLKLLWVHDIHCGPNSPDMERWLYRFDRVMCLSEWHKGFFLSQYPSLHADRVIVTRNGIDPGRFAEVVPKQNHLVFSSSPNRGLPNLLHNFQMIRQRVPDVQLHIYYGFDTWEMIAKQRGAQNELDEIARYKLLIKEATMRGGVHWHGKRPQSEVAAAYMRAKVWSYWTDFPETSCITAMEAQAAGCVPVASNLAALNETVKHGILIDNGHPDAGQQWLESVVNLFVNDSFREPFARAGREWALNNLSWSGLAKQWTEMFSNLIDEIAINPVPKYVGVK